MLMEAIVASVIAGTSVCSDHFDNGSRFQPQELSEYQQCVYIVHERNSGVIGDYVWIRNGYDFLYIHNDKLRNQDKEGIKEVVEETFHEKYQENFERAEELIEEFEDIIIDFPTEEERREFIRKMFDISNIDIPEVAIVLTTEEIRRVSFTHTNQYRIEEFSDNGDGTWTVRSLNRGSGETIVWQYTNRNIHPRTPRCGVNGGVCVENEGTVFEIVTGISIDGSNIAAAWLNNLDETLRQQIIDLVEDAYNQGYSDGYEDGYADGYVDGYVDGFRDGVDAARGN